jgi:hypothetical protein
VRARGGEGSGVRRGRLLRAVRLVAELAHVSHTIRSRVGEVVSGREVEAQVGGFQRPRVGRRSETRRACSRGLLEVGQSAGFRAVGVGGILDLLVASEAKGVMPEVEVHGCGGFWLFELR